MSPRLFVLALVGLALLVSGLLALAPDHERAPAPNRSAVESGSGSTATLSRVPRGTKVSGFTPEQAAAAAAGRDPGPASSEASEVGWRRPAADQVKTSNALRRMLGTSRRSPYPSSVEMRRAAKRAGLPVKGIVIRRLFDKGFAVCKRIRSNWSCLESHYARPFQLSNKNQTQKTAPLPPGGRLPGKGPNVKLPPKPDIDIEQTDAYRFRGATPCGAAGLRQAIMMCRRAAQSTVKSDARADAKASEARYR